MEFDETRDSFNRMLRQRVVRAGHRMKLITEVSLAATAARGEYGSEPVEKVCKAIGGFAEDPPDTAYQRKFLAELKRIAREKLA